jgi:ATP-dependent helicase/nuclease subunit A
LMETELGQTLATNSKKIIRELSLNFPDMRQAASEPFDRTMLRGRIDLLVPDERGFVLVDYKTDDVRAGGGLEMRGEFYRPQVRMYGQAIHTITGRKVHTTHLVFLAARQVVTVRT